MPPKLKDLTLSFVPICSRLSPVSKDLKRHVVSLYNSWYGQVPILFHDHQISTTPPQGRLKFSPLKLQNVFARNAGLKDPRVTNMLLMHGQVKLQEPTPPINRQTDEKQDEQEFLRNSGRVVWAAVILNGFNFLAKTTAWMYTGSHSMFAESVHSLADTANQLILAVGIRKSLQSPTADHPYGYHPMRYIAPLISGVGIFCVGCGLSVYHGLTALLSNQPELFVSPMWAYSILTFSLISESTTLIMALRALRAGALRSNLKIRDYIGRNSDPGVIVVLLEDVAAVMSIGIAATCMALSSYFGTHTFDACGSLMIGGLLGGVATFIIQKNTIALVGKSIPRDTLNNINRIIEKDILIRAIHDVKATDLGNGVVRYKAEVDVDGRELTKKYLEKIDLKELLEEIRDTKSEKDAESFILLHGEGVVDLLGAEVDRIEKEIRKNHPKVKHVDLEVL